MRTIWLALIPVVIGAGTVGHAGEIRARKATSRTIWAAGHTEVSNLPQTMPQPAPAMNHLPPAQLQAPLAAPTAPAPVAHAEHANGHGESCGHGKCKKKCCLLDWFCYRRRTDCCKGDGIGYWGALPLYIYFLGECREGACHATQCTGPTCGKSGHWGQVFDTGHRMFSMPTGQGCVGIR